MDPATIQRIKTVVDLSGRPLSELSLAAGANRAFLSNLFTKENAPDPGVTKMAKLAAALGVSLDYLLGPTGSMEIQTPEHASAVERISGRLMNDVLAAAQRRMAAEGYEPTMQDIMSWWRSSGGQLTSCGQIEQHFDLIRVPDPSDEIVEPYVVGAHSLAARQLNSNDPNLLKRLVQTMDERQRRDLVRSYSLASRETGRYDVTDHKVTIALPEVGSGFQVDYFRLLLPVKAGDGNDYVLSFCTLCNSP